MIAEEGIISACKVVVRHMAAALKHLQNYWGTHDAEAKLGAIFELAALNVAVLEAGLVKAG